MRISAWPASLRGGYTTLVMAGAVPDFGLVAEHCRLHPDDREICGAVTADRRFATDPGLQLPLDRRVRAVALMAPLSVVFDAAGLKDVSVPVLLFEAGNDHVLPNAWNVEHLAAALPRRPEPRVVDGGHFVFLAPCGTERQAASPTLCDDPVGIDRAPSIVRSIGKSATSSIANSAEAARLTSALDSSSPRRRPGPECTPLRWSPACAATMKIKEGS